MDSLSINTKPEINKLFNGDPLPGSYIIRDGKLEPNLNDEAMKQRNEKRQMENEKASDVSRLSSIDKEEIKKD